MVRIRSNSWCLYKNTALQSTGTKLCKEADRLMTTKLTDLVISWLGLLLKCTTPKQKYWLWYSNVIFRPFLHWCIINILLEGQGLLQVKTTLILKKLSNCYYLSTFQPTSRTCGLWVRRWMLAVSLYLVIQWINTSWSHSSCAHHQHPVYTVRHGDTTPNMVSVSYSVVPIMWFVPEIYQA